MDGWKIPVAPASHFMMGGIETNECGQTNVPCLFAVGEVACTGVHGANRLASNSLLEGLVFGKELGLYLQKLPKSVHGMNDQQSEACQKPNLPEFSELKEQMFKYAGIVRDEEGLLYLVNWLQQYCMKELLHQSFLDMTREEITRAFMLLTANSIVQSALLRKESRGAHFRDDVNEERLEWQDASILLCLTELEGRVVYEQVKA